MNACALEVLNQGAKQNEKKAVATLRCQGYRSDPGDSRRRGRQHQKCVLESLISTPTPEQGLMAPLFGANFSHIASYCAG